MSYTESKINPYRYGVLQGNHVEDRIGMDLACQNPTRKTGQTQSQSTYGWLNSIHFDHRNKIYEDRPHLSKVEAKDRKLRYYDNVDNNHQLHKCTENPYEMNIIDNGANQNNDPNVFSQYGNWVMNPALNHTTMYQVDDSGKGREKGVPASLLFGHGLKPEKFHERDFKSTNELGYDKKIRPQEFIKPNYRAEQTQRKEVFNVEATTQMLLSNDTVGNADTLKDTRRNGGFRHYDEFTKRFDATDHNLPLRK